MKKVFVVILHYKDLALTTSCVKALLRHEKKIEVIVVNNDSQNISPSYFSSKKVVCINNRENVGFAQGVNKGISYALSHQADAVVLLNNDVIIKKPFIQTLITALESDASLGIVGPAMHFLVERKSVYDIGGYVNPWTGKTYHKEVDAVKGEAVQYPAYITGAAICIRKEVFEKVGYFDEKFFLYYEDADFCLRARKAGFGIAVLPSVAVDHLLSKTIGKVSSFAIYHQTKSARVFGKKYFHTPVKMLLHNSFLFSQTVLLTMKYPHASMAAWRALFER